ncbi:VRR-Nuc domain protein [Microbacterium phage Camille]|nr:VRR-Nuc domain protein [Microbacterium phage Camille]
MARTPEGKFQSELVNSLEEIFTGCLIQKNDANYRQGVPDLLILFRNKWALLECKKSADAPARPNQPYYVEWAKQNSFGSFIFPENREEVIKELYAFFFDQTRGEN